jgi:NADPH:quinone reductase-like Zn-dependent oxidoreductase
MKAIAQDTYGTADVLEFRDIEDPAVGENDVLVRVHAAGSGPDVWHLMTGMPYMARLAIGFRRPKIRVRGWDVAGTVEAVGANVSDLRPGDEVMGIAEGSFAELAITGPDKLVPKPATLTFPQAAAVPVSGTTALRAVRDEGKVQPGQRVLVIGASGGVGSLAVQIAKAFGAHVTGVSSTSKTDLLRSIGADAPSPHPERHPRDRGRRRRRALDGRVLPRDAARAHDVPLRGSTAPRAGLEGQAGGPHHPHGADRGRVAHTGDRSDVPVDRGSRRDPVSRRGTRSREDRRHGVSRGSSNSMKAIVQNRYGTAEVLELRDIERPIAEDDEILVRVHAASIHADVWHVMRGVPYALRFMGAGVRRPKNLVPGTDLAGEVESVGRNVTRFRPGDEVFGQSLSANLWRHGGAFAEYAAVRAPRFEAKPAGLTFEQAAAVPTSGSLAVQGVRDEGRVQAGQRVLINGAGGAVGTFAVQLAKAYGAEVIGVDAPGKLEVLRSIGADRVVDYTEEDFTRSGERYDVIVDIAGNHPWPDIRRAITPEGAFVLIGHDHYGASGHRWFGSLGRFGKLLVMSPFVSQLHPFRGAKDPGDRLVVMKELIEAGKVTPVIDRTFPLSQVPEAMRYLESGRAVGKVVITIGA